jgi:hypothetical protein
VRPEDSKEGALAHAAAADYRNELAGLESEIQPVKDLSTLEGACQTGRGDER